MEIDLNRMLNKAVKDREQEDRPEAGGVESGGEKETKSKPKAELEQEKYEKKLREAQERNRTVEKNRLEIMNRVEDGLVCVEELLKNPDLPEAYKERCEWVRDTIRFAARESYGKDSQTYPVQARDSEGRLLGTREEGVAVEELLAIITEQRNLLEQKLEARGQAKQAQAAYEVQKSAEPNQEEKSAWYSAYRRIPESNPLRRQVERLVDDWERKDVNQGRAAYNDKDRELQLGEALRQMVESYKNIPEESDRLRFAYVDRIRQVLHEARVPYFQYHYKKGAEDLTEEEKQKQKPYTDRETYLIGADRRYRNLLLNKFKKRLPKNFETMGVGEQNQELALLALESRRIIILPSPERLPKAPTIEETESKKVETEPVKTETKPAAPAEVKPAAKPEAAPKAPEPTPAAAPSASGSNLENANPPFDIENQALAGGEFKKPPKLKLDAVIEEMAKRIVDREPKKKHVKQKDGLLVMLGKKIKEKLSGGDEQSEQKKLHKEAADNIRKDEDFMKVAAALAEGRPAPSDYKGLYHDLLEEVVGELRSNKDTWADEEVYRDIAERAIENLKEEAKNLLEELRHANPDVEFVVTNYFSNLDGFTQLKYMNDVKRLLANSESYQNQIRHDNGKKLKITLAAPGTAERTQNRYTLLVPPDMKEDAMKPFFNNAAKRLSEGRYAMPSRTEADIQKRLDELARLDKLLREKAPKPDKDNNMPSPTDEFLDLKTRFLELLGELGLPIRSWSARYNLKEAIEQKKHFYREADIIVGAQGEGDLSEEGVGETRREQEKRLRESLEVEVAILSELYPKVDLKFADNWKGDEERKIAAVAQLRNAMDVLKRISPNKASVEIKVELIVNGKTQKKNGIFYIKGPNMDRSFVVGFLDAAIKDGDDNGGGGGENQGGDGPKGSGAAGSVAPEAKKKLAIDASNWTTERKAAMLFLEKLPDFKDGKGGWKELADIKDDKELTKRILESLRDLKKDFTVESKGGKTEKYMDLDARTALALFRHAHINVGKIEFERSGTSKPNTVHLDTGNKEGFYISYEGMEEGESYHGQPLTVYFDHHALDSKRGSSSTKYVYETLKELGLMEPDAVADQVVEFVNHEDNRSFPDEEKYFKDTPYNLLGLGRRASFETLYQFFKDGLKPTDRLTEEQIDKYGFRKASEAQKQRVEKTEELWKEMERDGFVIDSKVGGYGKILVDVNGRFSREATGFVGAKAMGADALIIWIPRNRFFFLSTTGKEFPPELFGKGEGKGRVMRSTMWVKDDRKPLGLMLGEILRVMTNDRNLTVSPQLDQAVEAARVEAEVAEKERRERALARRAQSQNAA